MSPDCLSLSGNVRYEKERDGGAGVRLPALDEDGLSECEDVEDMMVDAQPIAPTAGGDSLA